MNELGPISYTVMAVLVVAFLIWVFNGVMSDEEVNYLLAKDMREMGLTQRTYENDLEFQLLLPRISRRCLQMGYRGYDKELIGCVLFEFKRIDFQL